MRRHWSAAKFDGSTWATTVAADAAVSRARKTHAYARDDHRMRSLITKESTLSTRHGLCRRIAGSTWMGSNIRVMPSPHRIALIASVGVLVTLAATGLAQPSASPNTQAAVTARIVAAAQAVVTTLDEAGRARVQFPFDGPQKARWSNLPSPMFQRTGVRMGDLTSTQRAAVMTLLSAALSRDGYRKVIDIMRGDEVLRTGQSSADASRGGGRGRGGGPGGGPAFGENQYYLAFVGTPSVTAPWMLQFGGHHLAINLTLGGSQAT